jgi:hypothetical protein
VIVSAGVPIRSRRRWFFVRRFARRVQAGVQ